MPTAKDLKLMKKSKLSIIRDYTLKDQRPKIFIRPTFVFQES